MMPGFADGVKRVFETIVMGFILAIVIRAILRDFGHHSYIILFDIISIIAIILLFDKMKYWSFFYLIGWLTGLILIASFLSELDIFLYIFVAIIVLVIKIRAKI